jgi:hypothetical protein
VFQVPVETFDGRWNRGEAFASAFVLVSSATGETSELQDFGPIQIKGRP